jgi:IMP dehydrogenase
MKTVGDVMTTDVIRLSPTNKIKTAIILMKGHNVGGLPVVDEDRVVGVLDYQDILGKDSDILVQNIMNREFVTIPPSVSVADAADLMAKIGSGRLLIMYEGRLAGVVTRGDLLPELGKSFDPITGLPRADAMRDWGISALKRGQEITVIFIDLDQFGQFNKKYGHITGDKVLQHAARVLRSHVNDERDMLCRYAGDEFVIVTTRDADEARELAKNVGDAISSTPNPELPETVSGAVGIHGGKRTKEREDVHYNATLDNLINLASKSCIRAKEHSMPVVAANGGAAASIIVRDTSAAIEQPEATPHERLSRLKIQGLNFSWADGSVASAEVELGNGVLASKRSRSGFALGNNALRLVAEATAEAVCDFLPTPGYGIVPESINVLQSPSGDDIVLVTVLLATPQAQIRVCGSAIVKQDAYRAISAAILNALNRRIAELV